MTELQVINLIESRPVREALLARGIDPFPSSTSPRGISPLQLAAMALVFDFNDFRPLNSKLKQLGLTTRQWNGWLRSNSRFANLVHRRAEAAFGELRPTAVTGLSSSLQKGDPSTLRLYFEMMGYAKNEATSVAQMRAVQELLVKTVEIIQQMVPDKAIQARIAGELARVFTGQDSGSSTQGELET